MIKKWIGLMLLAALTKMHGATITSVQCGAWSAPSTWNLNRTPLPADTIVVNSFVAFDTDFTSASPGMLNVTACGTLCGSHTYTGHFSFNGVIFLYSLVANYGHSESHLSMNIQQMMQVTGTGSYDEYGSTCVGCTSHCQNCSTNNRADSTACTQNAIAEYTSVRAKVFPNPMLDQLFIEGDLQTGEVEIYNAWGNLMLREPVKRNHLALDVFGFPKGMYFVQIGWSRYKIVKN